METTVSRRMAAACFVLALSSLEACTPATRPGELVVPSGSPTALLMSKPIQREAQGSGTVTVEVGVIAGPLPTLDMPPGAPVVVAWFSNAGEGGKKEKRYGFKPRAEAEYELTLMNDGSGRTKWTLNEVNRRTFARSAHSSGHLWLCDASEHPVDGPRDADFKDCSAQVMYDSAQANGALPRPARLASNTGFDTQTLTRLNAPIWISCTSGCCSLGR